MSEIAGLLAGLEASPEADIELDYRIEELTNPAIAGMLRARVGGWWSETEQDWPGPPPAYTASIDAAVALAEKLGHRPEDILPEALQEMTVGGYWPDRPMQPQIACAVLAHVLRALSQPHQSEGTSDA